MPNQQQLALIDGHALAFRAFHALRDAGLRSSRGEPTYAVFGFAQILLTMLQEQQPAYVAVAFDVGRTFRDDLYAEYKAGRAETPEEFHPQLERIQQFVRALNIPIFTAEGYEADDVIGSLARQAAAAGIDTLILTGDTDTLQLVDEHTSVLLANPYGQKTTTTLYDRDKVVERYKGLCPDQLADLRGLKGDTSDNIPGVKGIGETGAIQLLNQFGSIESLYAQLELVPNRYRKHLDGQQDAALFSKRLATIVCDTPVTLDLAAAQLHDYDRAAVIRMFQELEFGSSLLKKLPAGAGPLIEELPAPPEATYAAVQAPAAGGTTQLQLFDMPAAPLQIPAGPQLGNYSAITDQAGLDALIGELNQAPGFAFDTEITGLRPFEGELVGISLAIRPGAAYYIPLAHSDGSPQLDRQTVLNALRPFFADVQKPKYAHNAKFDIEVLWQAGLEVAGLTCDTMLAAGLLNKRVGLKDLAFYELGLPDAMTPITDLIGRGAKQITFDQVPVARATPYAAADADMTLRLTHKLTPQLVGSDAGKIFERLEMPLVTILGRMEQAGIGLDTAYMAELGISLGTRLAALEQEIYHAAQGEFNINSGPQLNEVLFQRIGIDPHKYNLSKLKSGGYSLTADVLELLSHEYNIARRLLEYRQLSKLKSTYVDSLPALVNPRSGRVHTSYNQLGAATGRLSSNDPNLQNIPVRTEEGRAIRRAFVAAPGCRFVAADYSQIELRVLAHITEDKNLIAAFQEGQDIHAATAAQLFGVAPDQVDKNQRRIAKTVVFGVIYGISAFGLASRLDVERGEAQMLIDALFARFPSIRDYIDRTLAAGKRDGYVQSLFGRRREMRDLNAGGNRQRAAEREAINAPIQATAADIMKLAMIQVDSALSEHNLHTRMLLQVHDELIFEAPEAEVATVATLVRDVMENAFTFDQVPLRADVEAGPNWAEMTPIA